jgi:hypothetical protein
MGNPVANRETEACAASFTRAGAIGAIKTIEDVSDVFGCDADPGVANFGDSEAVFG